MLIHDAFTFNNVSVSNKTECPVRNNVVQGILFIRILLDCELN